MDPNLTIINLPSDITEEGFTKFLEETQIFARRVSIDKPKGSDVAEGNCVFKTVEELEDACSRLKNAMYNGKVLEFNVDDNC